MLTTKKFDQLPHPNTFNLFIGNMLQLRKERINFFINQQTAIRRYLSGKNSYA
jgi:hypothetical protein